MVTLLWLVGGAAIGFGASKSGMFREGAGLVLLLLMVCAIVVAAVSGALSALLPAYIALWTGRIALACTAFVVAAYLGDR